MKCLRFVFEQNTKPMQCDPSWLHLVRKVEGSEVKAQLLLVLAWFHGVVQERRIFMPQGWTKEYDFSVGDLR